MPQKLSDTLLAWGAEGIDPKALHQAHVTSKMPFIHKHMALMPDAHWGMGATVGSVIPSVGAIMPAAVGVDIGCGMIAVETNLTASDLPDDLTSILTEIEQTIPAGVGQGHTDLDGYGDHKRFKRLDALKLHMFTEMTPKQKRTSAQQLGSLGSGNHFVEVCLNEGDDVWLVLHSGSRGIGNQLAMSHINRAKGLMKERFISLEDPDLAYFVEGDVEFGNYVSDLMWAQDYALQNRNVMMDALLNAVSHATGRTNMELQRINCHHNYTEQENHMGRNVWVSRKGAIRARVGDLGVIPGSMGTDTYIVRGLGHPGSFMSSPHGAGRKMSRTQAKKTLTAESLTEAMGDRTWLSDRPDALLDEHPDSYKDIEDVMRASADLVEVVEHLHQVLNYKGA